MRPATALPLPKGYQDDDAYVDCLLDFITSQELFRKLCGGVHILDFFTLDPPLYQSLLPQEWREWFDQHDLDSLLDFVLREDLSGFEDVQDRSSAWHGRPAPPASLVSYPMAIRELKLRRGHVARDPAEHAGQPSEKASTIPQSLAIGMKDKKIHEVESFARYVQDLSDRVSVSTERPITHVVDFGSGQNYLGRTLASKPYNKQVIAVESKHENIEGARAMDVHAKLAERTAPPRNKKKFRRYVQARAEREGRDLKDVLNEAMKADRIAQKAQQEKREQIRNGSETLDMVQNGVQNMTIQQPNGHIARARLDRAEKGTGSVQYVEHRLQDGRLQAVIDEIVIDSRVLDENDNVAPEHQLRRSETFLESNMMVVSIHSCGNLSHHGLRSLTLNPNVAAVALVGCCYNLVTERLTPPSHKLPSLRTIPQVDDNGDVTDVAISDKSIRCAGGDAHGFPMSEKLCRYPTPQGSGVHLNITARMMSLQAPRNWESEGKNTFFTRHFYRALLQRIFVDRGVVEPSLAHSQDARDARPADSTGRSNASTQAVIIGSLRKTAYTSFVSYVRAAVVKLSTPSNHHPTLACTDLAQVIVDKMAGLTDEQIMAYEAEYAPRKKDLSIVWTLMAYSAQLIEAVMVVDRWLWLKEQDEVEDCWAENVFDYSKSPRNMVVVGIKKKHKASA